MVHPVVHMATDNSAPTRDVDNQHSAGSAAPQFELCVSKEDFKFSAAHFVAHGSEREKLHGHNYRVSIMLKGPLGPDGCVIDFADLKKAVRSVCRSMDELFLCPLHSKTCKVVVGSKQVELTAQDGSYFSFPLQDCLLLPLENSTVEELSVYFAQRLVAALGKQILDERQISSLTVGIAETPGQEARYTMALSAR